MRFNAKIAAVFTVSLFTVCLISTHPAAAEEAAKQSTPAPTPQQAMVTVQPGDSLSAIADTNNTTWVRLFDANANVNDPNIINPGEQITVPTADAQLPDRYGQLTAVQTAAMPVVVAPVVQSHDSTSATSTAPHNANASAGNRYVWGTCAWYVYNRRPNIGSFWGNAGYNWLGEARAAGFNTGSQPEAGAIGVEAGHVVIVESVSGGMVNISEMNYGGGVGVVHYRTVPASEFEYIY